MLIDYRYPPMIRKFLVRYHSNRNRTRAMIFFVLIINYENTNKHRQLGFYRVSLALLTMVMVMVAFC